MDTRCQICQRLVRTTEHHLIPKTVHKKYKKKKKLKREVLNQTIDCCRDCHDHIHILYSEKELGREFNTLEKLLQDEQLQKFIKFIRKRKY